MTKHDNKLASAELERLALLAAEMGETLRLVGKTLLYGYQYEPSSESESTSRALLAHHLGNVLYVIDLLCNSNDIDCADVREQSQRYARTIGTFLNHQGAAS